MRITAILFALALLIPSSARAQEFTGDESDRQERIDAALVAAEEALKGLPDDYEVIESPFAELELACIEGRVGDACYLAGESWYSGRGIDAPNIVQAVNLWQAGCSFGNTDSCWLAGHLIAQGKADATFREDGVLIVDLRGADKLLTLACAGGIFDACLLRGDLNVAPKSVMAEGAIWPDFEPDIIRGRQSYEAACPAEGEAATADLPREEICCSRLARMYEDGRGGVRRDRDLAQLYWDLACDAGGADGASCADSERLRDSDPDDPGDPLPRTSVQPQRPRPDTTRFQDPGTGAVGALADTTESHFRRWEFEGGVGARVRYSGGEAMGLFKIRAGTSVWFNMVGIDLTTAFSTDRFAGVSARRYTRFQHALSVKFEVPIRFKNPWGALAHFGWGAGGTLGSVKLHPAPFVIAYGAREWVQLQLGTSQSSGPRQWFALRIEQQQTWHRGGGPAPDHSTQFVLIAGFTFGGKSADWNPVRHGD